MTYWIGQLLLCPIGRHRWQWVRLQTGFMQWTDPYPVRFCRRCGRVEVIEP